MTPHEERRRSELSLAWAMRRWSREARIRAAEARAAGNTAWERHHTAEAERCASHASFHFHKAIAPYIEKIAS